MLEFIETITCSILILIKHTFSIKATLFCHTFSLFWPPQFKQKSCVLLWRTLCPLPTYLAGGTMTKYFDFVKNKMVLSMKSIFLNHEVVCDKRNIWNKSIFLRDIKYHKRYSFIDEKWKEITVVICANAHIPNTSVVIQQVWNVIVKNSSAHVIEKSSNRSTYHNMFLKSDCKWNCTMCLELSNHILTNRIIVMIYMHLYYLCPDCEGVNCHSCRNRSSFF